MEYSEIGCVVRVTMHGTPYAELDKIRACSSLLNRFHTWPDATIDNKAHSGNDAYTDVLNTHFLVYIVP